MITLRMVEQGTVTASVDQFFTYATEASSLGWAPGVWPSVVETDLGNKGPFIMVDLREDGGLYKQEFGCITLRVFND